MGPKDSTPTDETQARTSKYTVARYESGACPWCEKYIRCAIQDDGKRHCVFCDCEFYAIGKWTWSTHAHLGIEIAAAMLGGEGEQNAEAG